MFCILYSWFLTKLQLIANEWSGKCETKHEPAPLRKFTLLRARAKWETSCNAITILTQGRTRCINDRKDNIIPGNSWQGKKNIKRIETRQFITKSLCSQSFKHKATQKAIINRRDPFVRSAPR
ncbi:hypothetical protein EAF00_005837 [Botryotinia globosa]|nr:hypothetical protein EAF00_005837 [Botryotinia globosa]